MEPQTVISVTRTYLPISWELYRSKESMYYQELTTDNNLEGFLCQPTEEVEWQIRPFFGCLVSALSHSHKNRILYEDIKPQNILLKVTASCSPTLTWPWTRRNSAALQLLVRLIAHTLCLFRSIHARSSQFFGLYLVSRLCVARNVGSAKEPDAREPACSCDYRGYNLSILSFKWSCHINLDRMP